jgi:hypothetical protein
VSLFRASVKFSGNLGVIYSFILACDFKNLMLFLLYLYNVTSNVRDFAVSDFQILKLNGSPELFVTVFVVVFFQSTGDSLDDDDHEEEKLSEAKRNTSYNEVIDADNPQTPSEVHGV